MQKICSKKYKSEKFLQKKMNLGWKLSLGFEDKYTCIDLLCGT
jgi:hypothetical protein